MNIRTIYLAIRVVKTTLSDTRFKVTGQRPGRGWCLEHPAGEAGGGPAGGLHSSHVLWGGEGSPAKGPLVENLASWPALSKAGGGEAPRSCGPAPETLALIKDLEFPSEGAQTPPWTEERLSESSFIQSRVAA